MMCRVTDAMADGSAIETAVRVTKGELGMIAGAWYESLVISPHDVPEQPKPETLHLTLFSLVPVPVTIAVTTFEPPSGTSL